MVEKVQYNIGLIGLGVMGRNLALNFESRGFAVAVYNRTRSVTEEFIKEHGDKNVSGFFSIEEFASVLGKPRKIFIMVSAEAVDAVIKELLPYLGKGDIVIDAGNSFFKDSMLRAKFMEEKNIHFVSCGISGGEEGALKGPSIMFGGSAEALEHIRPMLERIAAKAFNGSPCCAYMGQNGAGHYVKMVHNGIEYIDMQLISEAYHILKESGFSNDEISSIFFGWNKTEMNSYLIEITSKIFTKRDTETGKYLIDIISDEAEQKGTGKWASQNSFEIGVPAYSLNAAVLARFMSMLKKERISASRLAGPRGIKIEDKESFIKMVFSALYASKICAYAQGFSLLSAASDEYKWDLNFGEIAHIWEGGCIIRAIFLENVKSAFEKNKNLRNLLLDGHFLKEIKWNEINWRNTVSFAVQNKIPVPGFSSAIAYYDSYLAERLPSNLIQAQRDFFGAHTYKRTDKEGTFHTNWDDEDGL